MVDAIKGSCPLLHEFYIEQGVTTPCPFCLQIRLNELNNQPKITEELGNMIINSVNKMLLTHTNSSDPRKQTDLKNLIKIVTNSIQGK